MNKRIAIKILKQHDNRALRLWTIWGTSREERRENELYKKAQRYLSKFQLYWKKSGLSY